jgi:hypothetical protein
MPKYLTEFFRLTSQAKLEEAERRLEGLKALEAKIADLERELEEKSKDVEVRFDNRL